MSNVVCYQYKKEVSDGREPEIEWFTPRQMEGKTECGHYLFEDLSVIHTPIAAWKIKNYRTNFQFVIPEGSFFAQSKPLNEFLKNGKH